MRQNSQHQPKPKPGGKHQFLQFWDHLKTGDRDREGRGEKRTVCGPSKKETFMQRSGRSQKNDEFCPNKVLVDLFVWGLWTLDRTDTCSCGYDLTLLPSWALNKDLQLFKPVKKPWKCVCYSCSWPAKPRHHHGNRDCLPNGLGLAPTSSPPGERENSISRGRMFICKAEIKHLVFSYGFGEPQAPHL